MKTSFKKLGCAIAAVSALSAVTSASIADTYEVSITNATQGQAFTPRLVVTHPAGKLFNVGRPALSQLEIIAEGGDIGPLMDVLAASPAFTGDMQVGEGLLMPGETSTVTIEGQPGEFVSLVNMLIPTNDAFVGVNAVTLPASGHVTVNAVAYDAGTETNDELCANIPGPVCGGAGGSPEDAGEGFISVHPGIHGTGDLEAENYDWRNPVAIVKISWIQ